MKRKQPKRDHRSQSAKQALPSAVAAADEARHQAIKMRIAGHAFRDIADVMNVSVSTAYKYVNDGWDRINELTDDDRRRLRHQEVERINECRKICMELIRAENLVMQSEDRKGNVVSKNAALLKLRAIDRVVKLGRFHTELFGVALAAPKDADPIENDNKFIPLDQLARSVAEQQRVLASATVSTLAVVPVRVNVVTLTSPKSI